MEHQTRRCDASNLCRDLANVRRQQHSCSRDAGYPWLVKDGQPFIPADCLAKGGNPQSCGIARSKVLVDRNPTLDFVARFPLLKPLDMSDAICRTDTCRAVEGNVLVYRDSHHLTPTYMRTMTSELGRQIAANTDWW